MVGLIGCRFVRRGPLCANGGPDADLAPRDCVLVPKNGGFYLSGHKWEESWLCPLEAMTIVASAESLASSEGISEAKALRSSADSP